MTKKNKMIKLKDLLFESDIDWSGDFYSARKSLTKKYPAMTSNQKSIKAAKEVAKTYKISYKDILKTIDPDNNIRGDKSWDRDGNVI